MMYAYDKMYLEKARIAMGRMLDFAVNQIGYDIDEYFDIFITSGLAKRFETGDVSILAGKSGVEMAYDVLIYNKSFKEPLLVEYTVEKSPQYWVGWALAYYQWLKNVSFESIIQVIPLSKVTMLYSPYHEMDIRQFVDKMDELYSQANIHTKLKQRRLQVGLSQSQLAEVSGVPVRTIQQYEQRQKDINKANVMTVICLAKALYCNVQDLIEMQV